MKNTAIFFLTILLCGAVKYCYGNNRQCCSTEICDTNTISNDNSSNNSSLTRRSSTGNGTRNSNSKQIDSLKRQDTLLNLRVDTLFLQMNNLVQSIDSLKNDVATLKEQINSGNKSKSLWLFVVVFLIIGALVVYIVIDRKKRREDIIKIVQTSERLKDWRNAADVTIDKSQLPTPKLYDSAISDLQKRIADLEDIEKQHKNNNTEPDKEQGKSIKPEEKKLYAVSIIDGYLQRVKDTANEDTVFELCLKGASKADITVYKSAYEKILDNPSHLEGCDKQIVGRTSVNVEQVGEAVTDDSGRWRVVKPLKVLVK